MEVNELKKQKADEILEYVSGYSGDVGDLTKDLRVMTGARVDGVLELYRTPTVQFRLGFEEGTIFIDYQFDRTGKVLSDTESLVSDDRVFYLALEEFLEDCFGGVEELKKHYAWQNGVKGFVRKLTKEGKQEFQMSKFVGGIDSDSKVPILGRVVQKQTLGERYVFRDINERVVEGVFDNGLLPRTKVKRKNPVEIYEEEKKKPMEKGGLVNRVLRGGLAVSGAIALAMALDGVSGGKLEQKLDSYRDSIKKERRINNARKMFVESVKYSPFEIKWDGESIDGDGFPKIELANEPVLIPDSKGCGRTEVMSVVDEESGERKNYLIGFFKAFRSKKIPAKATSDLIKIYSLDKKCKLISSKRIPINSCSTVCEIKGKPHLFLSHSRTLFPEKRRNLQSYSINSKGELYNVENINLPEQPFWSLWGFDFDQDGEKELIAYSTDKEKGQLLQVYDFNEMGGVNQIKFKFPYNAEKDFKVSLEGSLVLNKEYANPLVSITTNLGSPIFHISGWFPTNRRDYDIRFVDGNIELMRSDKLIPFGKSIYAYNDFSNTGLLNMGANKFFYSQSCSKGILTVPLFSFEGGFYDLKLLKGSQNLDLILITKSGVEIVKN